MLYKLLNLDSQVAGTRFKNFVSATKALSKNWTQSIPQILAQINESDVTIDLLFAIERNVTFKLASLVSDINILYNRIHPEQSLDLSPAITRFSNAFLPPNVYSLEEYGLPRMIARKIHLSGLIDLENTEYEFSSLLDKFRFVGLSKLIASVENLDSFDIYVLKYFFEGITVAAAGIQNSGRNRLSE